MRHVACEPGLQLSFRNGQICLQRSQGHKQGHTACSASPHPAPTLTMSASVLVFKPCMHITKLFRILASEQSLLLPNVLLLTATTTS